MRPANTPRANLGLFDRLSVKLLLLFLATFLIAFLALWAYGISTSYLESSLAEAAAPQAPQPVVIDPNLRNELSQVMATTDATVEQAAIKDPFNDRSGLAGLNAVQRAVGGIVATSGAGGGATADGGTLNAARVSSNRDGRVGGPGSPGTLPAELPAKEGTKVRFDEWLRLSETDDIPLNSMVFAVDDLLPVGLVDGGNGQQEVLFYSEAVARTFSFPVGTRFYDGWFSELRPDGVVFASYGERPTAKMRVWTRNLRSVG